jgi:FkbM family methyltransferase
MSYEYYYSIKDKNYPILITKKTLDVTPYTFQRNGQIWETTSIQQFFSCVDNKPYNIIDIGAQSGLYSLFAKYLPNSTFYSFEPFIDTFNCLNDNLKLNNINNVKTFNLGISDKSGTNTLNTSIGHNGLHTMGNNPLRFDDIKPITINTTTLDDFFYNKNIPVHFIKIDTEGWEYNILKGAQNTIKKYKPVIQLEWNITNMKQCNVNEQDLLSLLNNHGYYEKSTAGEEKLFYPLGDL